MGFDLDILSLNESRAKVPILSAVKSCDTWFDYLLSFSFKYRCAINPGNSAEGTSNSTC